MCFKFLFIIIQWAGKLCDKSGATCDSYRAWTHKKANWPPHIIQRSPYRKHISLRVPNFESNQVLERTMNHVWGRVSITISLASSCVISQYHKEYEKKTETSTVWWKTINSFKHIITLIVKVKKISNSGN